MSLATSESAAAEAQALAKADATKVVHWDKVDVPDLLSLLKTDLDKGLSEADAAERHERDGPNELNKNKRPTFAMLFLMQLMNLIIALLMIAAVASLIVGATSPDNKDPIAYVDSIAIFLIVFINATIGAVTENSAAGALEALTKLSQPKSLVIRDGKEMEVSSLKIVKGDVVLLKVGDITPADVRLIEADDFKVNEMLLTGEAEDVNKHARMKVGGEEEEKLTPENMSFSSCMVTNGKAKCVVVEIGMNTRMGRIAKLLSQKSTVSEKSDVAQHSTCQYIRHCECLPDMTANQTPLQTSLMNLTVKLGIFAIIGCVFVFLIGVWRKVYNLNDPLNQTYVDATVYMILIAVTLAVASIPESLPICVTIALATGCSDMVKEKVLVRRIAAVETLGCASVICTDKTGTLTEGKMSMVKMWSAGEDFDVSGKGFDPTVGKIMYHEQKDRNGNESAGVVSTLTSATLCCNTKVVKNEDGQWVPHGNSSEAPIIVAAAKVGQKAEVLAQSMPRIFEVPFSSKRKMMLTVVKLEESSAEHKFVKVFTEQKPKFIANVKGAPNFIIKDCDSWVTPDGKVVPLTEENKKKIMTRVDELSSEALRVLAVASRPIAEMPFDYDDKDSELSTDEKFELVVKKPGLVLLGLVASIDPERDGVPQAVLDAQGGHIRVVMITGDYLPTAIAIAHNVNILRQDDDDSTSALDCGKLRPGDNGQYLSREEIDALTKTVKVFARAQPEDKLQIVKSLQRQGLVCAMTGDGVNDAPALNRADIGVAMGLNGTEVAKGASDVILTDDNFCSIVNAVEKGRIIYAGIQKFVAFILSVHLAEVIQIFLCIVADLPVMRTPIQILFLVLVTDMPPSVALGMERVARDIMKDRPRPKNQPIVMRWQLYGIIANAFILICTTVPVYIWGLHYYLKDEYTNPEISLEICDQDCLDRKTAVDTEAIIALQCARTTAFISLVMSDNVRAYASRSFTEPIWVDLCTNPTMQKAILFAQIALYCAVFIPGLSDLVLELRGYEIGWRGWVAAILGCFSTMVLCELYKYFSKGLVGRAEEKQRAELEKVEAEREKLVQDRRNQLKEEKLKEGNKVVAMAPDGRDD